MRLLQYHKDRYLQVTFLFSVAAGVAEYIAHHDGMIMPHSHHPREPVFCRAKMEMIYDSIQYAVVYLIHPQASVHTFLASPDPGSSTK